MFDGGYGHTQQLQKQAYVFLRKDGVAHEIMGYLDIICLKISTGDIFFLYCISTPPS